MRSWCHPTLTHESKSCVLLLSFVAWCSYDRWICEAGSFSTCLSWVGSPQCAHPGGVSDGRWIRGTTDSSTARICPSTNQHSNTTQHLSTGRSPIKHDTNPRIDRPLQSSSDLKNPRQVRHNIVAMQTIYFGGKCGRSLFYYFQFSPVSNTKICENETINHASVYLCSLILCLFLWMLLIWK
jgi:hypothetical protein